MDPGTAYDRRIKDARFAARMGAAEATLFDSGRAKFAGRFPALEEQLCGLTWEGEYQGRGKSPDRADAMVWAMTELMIGRGAMGGPRIRRL